jgi:hypothetical protein
MSKIRCWINLGNRRYFAKCQAMEVGLRPKSGGRAECLPIPSPPAKASKASGL